MGRRRNRREDEHEPEADPADLEHIGDETIFVVGRTEAGLPYGPTIEDIRTDLERHSTGAGWARAKRILRELLDRQGVEVREIGRVTKVGDGLSREVYGANVELRDGTEQAYVVLLPTRRADAELTERTTRELRLLSRLRARSLPFRVPVMVGVMREGRHAVLVRHYVSGIPLDLRAGRQPSVRPWEIVGGVAAAIHTVPGTEVEDVAIGFPTRRAHALDQLTGLEDLEPAEMRAALAWAREHLPPDEPSTLVHGDLLGQNILLSLDGPHHVIDWEYALRGDPAYDLAIVTRGTKQPFQIAGGLARLLEAYEAHGGRGVTADHVRVHELSLIAHHYREALAGRGPQPPAFELDRMRGMLRRLP